MEMKRLPSMKSFSANGFVRKRVWQTDKFHCNIYCFEPAQQNSLHRHPVSDELVIGVGGEGLVVVGDGQQPIKDGDPAMVPYEHSIWVYQYEQTTSHGDYGRAMSPSCRACARGAW